MSTSPIPEIKATPWVGVATDLIRNPTQFLTDAQAERDIVQFKLFGQTVYAVADPEMIREILVTKYTKFKKDDRAVGILGRVLGDGLLTYQDVAEHRDMRRLAQPAFHMNRIRSYAEIMVEYADEMVSGWQDGMVADMGEEMMALTMFIVSKTLFDMDKDEMLGSSAEIGGAIDEIQELLDKSLNSAVVVPEWIPTSTNRRTRAARKVMETAIDRMVDERRSSAEAGTDRGDLLSMYLQAEFEDGSKMSSKRIQDEMITLFAAGHETTANTLTWTLYLLSQHPEVAAKLREEVDQVLDGRLPTFEDLPDLVYTEMVIKESMRVRPPLWAIVGRQPIEDVQVGGYMIPKNGLIFISPYVTHRLSAYFPQPERFDPERFLPEKEAALPKFAYIPFGGGPRVCIGNSFAMMEARLILATIVQRCSLELARELPVELNAQLTLSPLGGMRMRVTARETLRASAETRPPEAG